MLQKEVLRTTILLIRSISTIVVIITLPVQRNAVLKWTLAKVRFRHLKNHMYFSNTLSKDINVMKGLTFTVQDIFLEKGIFVHLTKRFPTSSPHMNSSFLHTTETKNKHMIEIILTLLPLKST